jgi:hypothetical protein
VQTALESADRYLVKDQAGTILLLRRHLMDLVLNLAYQTLLSRCYVKTVTVYHAAVWLAMAWLRSDAKIRGCTVEND